MTEREGSAIANPLIKSPFPHICLSNNTPTIMEGLAVRETVVPATDMLASVNAITLEKELKVLSVERDRMTEPLAAYRALPPIRKMPPELMSKIFIHCLPNDDFLRPRPKDAPLLVTQICSLWRSMAFSTPSLWSSIELKNSNLSESNSRSAELQIWLSRAGACPLFLSLQEFYQHRGISQCLEVVISQLSHCRKLSLGLSLPVELVTVISRMSLPILESVELRVMHSTQPNILTNGVFEAFAKAPCLQSIQTELRRYILSHTSHFPWSQLSNLTLEDILSFRECLQVLRHCQALTACWLQFYQEANDVPNVASPESVVRLPRLTTFKIEMSYEESDNNIFLNYLILPVLRHLDGIHMDSSSSLTNLLARSGCQLETLNLTFVGHFFFETQDFQALLEQTPSLYKLCIYSEATGDVWNDEIIVSLTPRLSHDGTQAPCLLPKLQVLRIAIGSEFYPSDDNLKDMLRSRLSSSRTDEDGFAMRTDAPVAFLKEAEICFCDPFMYDPLRRWYITDTEVVSWSEPRHYMHNYAHDY